MFRLHSMQEVDERCAEDESNPAQEADGRCAEDELTRSKVEAGLGLRETAAASLRAKVHDAVLKVPAHPDVLHRMPMQRRILAPPKGQWGCLATPTMTTA